MKEKTIYLAGGCFWGAQRYFELLQGVLNTEVGYANGITTNPTYREVCMGKTGHAEAVKIVYDAAVISLPFLLSMYYEIIDPTSLNRQGGDVGTQYRTGIYYTENDEKSTIADSVSKLQEKYQKPVAIEVRPLENYATAEEYHQAYLKKNPGGYCHIGESAFKKARSATPASFHEPKTPAELKSMLTPMQYQVTQENGTEPPFDNAYYKQFEAGIYVDIITGEPLFLSADKFESDCGWPAFSKPVAKEMVHEIADKSHGMIRTEVRSKDSIAHLGHVFEDGPKEMGGLRYCINSAALRFIPKSEMRREGYEALEDLV